MSSWKRLVSVSGLLLSGFAAQSALADNTSVFTSVSGYQYTASNPMTGQTAPATLTVIKAGDTSPSVYTLPDASSVSPTCQGFILDMIHSPGVYTLTISSVLNLSGKEVLIGCFLDRV